jgi:hypothetical protein
VRVHEHAADGARASVRQVGPGEMLSPSALPDVSLDVTDIVVV